jgi:hypothetical protein
VTLTLPDFDTMWTQYPTGTSHEVKALIGGNVDASWITNTCAIRLSRCFNYANTPIPKGTRGLNTVSGGDGLRYAYRVREFRDAYMLKRYGPATVVHVNEGDGGPVPDAFVGRRGLICFDVRTWSDATGHLDLWDGSNAAGKAYFDVAKEIWLWDVALPNLSGSVGIRGANHRDDVALIQQLLANHGHDPGPIDGLCGSRTIAAIKSFQAGFLSTPDGRISPNFTTWKHLVGLA